MNGTIERELLSFAGWRQISIRPRRVQSMTRAIWMCGVEYYIRGDVRS